MSRRLGVVLLLAGMIAATSIVPASADELTNLLDSAAEADYAGRRIVITFIDGTTSLEIIDVEHAGSMMMVGTDGNESVLGSGKLSGDGGGLAVSAWNSSQMSDRYEVGESTPVKRLSRPATSVAIRENGVLRMNLVFDDATGTPLVTEIYDGAGKLFRLTSMLEIDPIPDKLYSAQGHYSGEFDVLVRTTRHSLPSEAAGYILADAYTGPDDSVQGFYSDGLFTFSLFVVDGPAEADRFADATTVDVNGLNYRRLVSPSEMWVTWESGGDTYVLVGDLPPDHLDHVLRDLPKPARRNIFSRFWSNIFG